MAHRPLFFLAFAFCFNFSRPSYAAAVLPNDLAALLEPIRAKFNLPALAAAVIEGDRVSAIGATGVRRFGQARTATSEDRWHLGSNSKAMTATVLARLVEEGRLSWTFTLESSLPELSKDMNPAYRRATLEQLLSHRSGLPGDIPHDVLWRRQGTPSEQRMALVREMLKRTPAAKPGSTYIYSNAGYAVAGVIAERVLGQPWEDILRSYLLNPLKMADSDFGVPAASNDDQPTGHTFQGGIPVPILAGAIADNPPAIAPAGTLHASLHDWSQFAMLHLAGAQGKGRLLTPDSFRKLQSSPSKQDYAMGWGVVARPWAGGDALTHSGSNTMWYAIIWLAPKKDFGLLIVTNIGGDPAAKACDEAVAALISQRNNP